MATLDQNYRKPTSEKIRILCTSDDYPDKAFSSFTDFQSHIITQISQFFEPRDISIDKNIIVYTRGRRGDNAILRILKNSYPQMTYIEFAPNWKRDQKNAGLVRNNLIFENEIHYLWIYLTQENIEGYTGLEHILYLSQKNDVQIKFLNKVITHNYLNFNCENFHETQMKTNLPVKNSNAYYLKLEQTKANVRLNKNLNYVNHQRNRSAKKSNVGSLKNWKHGIDINELIQDQRSNRNKATTDAFASSNNLKTDTKPKKKTKKPYEKLMKRIKERQREEKRERRKRENLKKLARKTHVQTSSYRKNRKKNKELGSLMFDTDGHDSVLSTSSKYTQIEEGFGHENDFAFDDDKSDQDMPETLQHLQDNNDNDNDDDEDNNHDEDTRPQLSDGHNSEDAEEEDPKPKQVKNCNSSPASISVELISQKLNEISLQKENKKKKRGRKKKPKEEIKNNNNKNDENKSDEKKSDENKKVCVALEYESIDKNLDSLLSF